MNLRESIRRILREEDFIPLEDLNTVIKDYEGGFDVFIMDGDKKIGEISFTKEDQPNQYTIVDATIDDEYKGNRIYPKTIINLFKERPNIIINSVFRSPEAQKAWIYLLSNLPSNIGKSVKYYKEEDTTLFQLKSRNLQESIKRILREEIQFPLFIRRRFTQKELDKLVNDINKKVNNEINYNLDDIIYDNVRQLIGSKSQQIGLDQHAEESVFWSLYIKYEKPLVDYVKDRLFIE
jgi:hypothetical protein